MLLSILLHVATLFAVIIVFRKQIWEMIKHPFCKTNKMLIVATIPTIIIVLAFRGFFEDAFLGAYLAICFMITAVVLVLTSIFSKQKQSEMNYKSAFLMGVGQGIAVLPGISRSGTTLCTGLVVGQGKKQATEFSFLMSIPVIFCSLIFELYNGISAGESLFMGNFLLVAMAFVVALVSGVFAIKVMLKIVQKGKLWYFSVYLVLLSVLCLFVLY